MPIRNGCVASVMKFTSVVHSKWRQVSPLAGQLLAFRPVKVKATPIRCRRAREEIENPAGAQNCASLLSVEPYVYGKKLRAGQPLRRRSTRPGALEMLRLQYCWCPNSFRQGAGSRYGLELVSREGSGTAKHQDLGNPCRLF